MAVKIWYIHGRDFLGGGGIVNGQFNIPAYISSGVVLSMKNELIYPLLRVMYITCFDCVAQRVQQQSKQ